MKRNQIKTGDAAADRKAVRHAERERRLAAMADGRRERAVTFADRRKAANQKACRGRVVWE